MGLTMSLCGMFNTGHDVGGFHGPVPDPELLVRWVQSGAFSPRFIMNSWKSGGEVNTPWMHPSVLPIIRDWIRLRYRLLPYLYSLYWRAAEFGEPILRPLFYDDDHKPRCAEGPQERPLRRPLRDDSRPGTGNRVSALATRRTGHRSRARLTAPTEPSVRMTLAGAGVPMRRARCRALALVAAPVTLQ